jgi:hypothetical protein
LKKVSINILLITLLILINLSIFLFCKLLTDEENYLWYKTASDKILLVSMASMDIMRIRYFIYANSINFILLGIYFVYTNQKRTGGIIALIGIGILTGGNKLFEDTLAENYYIIFKNQNVPEDFMLEPVKSAGKKIGPELMKELTNNTETTLQRKLAIEGLGEIKYEPATDILNEILHNLKEKPEIRGEAYLSLLKINTERSASYTRIFIGSLHPIADQEVMRYIRSKERN